MFRNCSLVALALMAARVASSASAAVPDLVPPETKVVVGIEWRKILDSPVAGSYLAEAKASSSKWLAQSPLAGLDPFQDLDEIVIATTGAKENAPSLVVVRGRFDVTRMKTTPYHGVPMVENQGSGDVVAFLDGATAIAGKPAQVRAAIDRKTRGKAMGNKLAARVEEMGSRYAIWAVGEMPEGVQMPSGAPQGLDAMDRFEFGASLQQGLELTASAHMRTAAAAEKMAASLKMLEAMAKMQPAANGTRFETKVADNTLQISVTVPEEALRKGIEQQKLAMAQAFAKMAPGNTPGTVKITPMPGIDMRMTAPAAAPSRPATHETQVVSAPDGRTVLVTLPGGR